VDGSDWLPELVSLVHTPTLVPVLPLLLITTQLLMHVFSIVQMELLLPTSVQELLLEEVVVLPVLVTPTLSVPQLVLLVMELVPPVVVVPPMIVLHVTDGGITELPINLVN